MVLILGLVVLALLVIVGVIVVLVSNRGGEVITLRPPAPGQQSTAETGRPVSLPPKSSVLREVNDSEIEQQIRSGHLIDAIKLYREKTGVGLKEAKDAVAAWRDRIRAS